MTKKVLVDEKGKAWITCNQCGHTVEADLIDQGDHGYIFNYKCTKCGALSEVTCEFRKSFRKEVVLNGTFIQQEPKEEYAGRIEISNISKNGIKFKTRVKYNFKPGYILNISFSLNDRNNTVINNQTIEVRWINGLEIGGKFLRQEPWVQQKLGFYFMA